MNPVLHWVEGFLVFSVCDGFLFEFGWGFFWGGGGVRCLGFGFGFFWGGSVLVFLKPFTPTCSKNNTLFPSL